MQQKYTRDANRRIHFHPHWVQDICRRCAAWLPEMPDHEIPVDRRWRLVWTCVRCKFRNSTISGTPLSAFTPDPGADIAPPGQLPAWRGWRLPSRLVRHLESVARHYATDATADDLRGLPSLLDHEGVHHAPWGEFSGSRADPTGLRLQLARLRHAPATVQGALPAALIAERAVLAAGAVMEELSRIELLAAAIVENHSGRASEMDRAFSVPFLFPADLECGECVAPVIGAGRLSIANRYEDWLLTYGAYPWFGGRHVEMHRGPIPAHTEVAASCIEISDTILNAIGLFNNADSHLDLLNDVIRLQKLMADWRRLQSGCWDVNWHWDRHWPKLPDDNWLKQWEQP